MTNSGGSDTVTHDPHTVDPLDHGIQTHGPASAVAQEHRHGRDDEPGYSKDTTMLGKTTTTEEESQHHDLHRRHLPEDRKIQPEMSDPEKADLALGLAEEPDSRSGSFSKFYVNYRVFFHLAIWLFFTG